MRALPSRNQQSIPADSDLQRLEEYFGRRLPDSYKEFLRVNNNVWMAEGFEETILPDQVPIQIDRFYNAINSDGKIPEVVEINHVYGQRLPAETITIGSDVYGNQLLLVIEDSDSGCVLIWDHEHEGFEEPPPDPYHNVYELAPDLETFVNAIGCPKAG